MGDQRPVVALRPAPDQHHADCTHGCSHGGAWLAGPCQQQCVKTDEFLEQSARDAQASRVRFSRRIIPLSAAEAPPAAPRTVGESIALLIILAACGAWLAAVAYWLGTLA